MKGILCVSLLTLLIPPAPANVRYRGDTVAKRF